MAAVPKPALSISNDGNTVVVLASGELDFAVAEDMLQTVEIAAANSTVCLLDCEQVTFIDSEALRTLFELCSRFRAAGKSFCLRNPSKHVTRILALLGLQEEIPQIRG